MDKLVWFLAGVLTTVGSWWGLSILEMTGTPRRKKPKISHGIVVHQNKRNVKRNSKYACKTCGGRLHPGLGCGPDTTGMEGGPTT